MSSSGAEPEAKKAKTSSDDIVNFRDPDTPHDRVLLVNDEKFYVQSDVLISCSEYFRAMFTSGFQEENQQEILVKNVSVVQIEKFLMATMNPEDITWTQMELKNFIHTCSFLGSEKLLLKVLDARRNFDRVKKEDMLEIARVHGLTDLRVRVEDNLIWRFERMKGDKQKMELFLTGVEYQLDKLLDSIDKTFAIFSSENCGYVMANYSQKDTEFFKKRIEMIENSLMQRLSEQGTSFFSSLAYPYIKKWEEPGQMTELIHDYHLQNLKKSFCDLYIDEYKKNDERGFAALYYYEQQALKLPHFEEFTDLEVHISAWFIKTFESKGQNFIQKINYAVKYHLPGFKEHLVKKFSAMRDTDPFVIENKEAIDNLDKDARAFLMDNLLKE